MQLTDPFGPLRAGELDLQHTEFPVAEPDLTAGPVVFAEPAALMVPARHRLARRSPMRPGPPTVVERAGRLGQYFLVGVASMLVAWKVMP